MLRICTINLHGTRNLHRTERKLLLPETYTTQPTNQTARFWSRASVQVSGTNNIILLLTSIVGDKFDNRTKRFLLRDADCAVVKLSDAVVFDGENVSVFIDDSH